MDEASLASYPGLAQYITARTDSRKQWKTGQGLGTKLKLPHGRHKTHSEQIRSSQYQASLKPRLSIPDFISQLWRKIGGTDFSPKLQDKIQNGKPGFEASIKPSFLNGSMDCTLSLY